MRDVVECCKCHSKRIGFLRIDSDWASGAGSFTLANDDKSLYEKRDIEEVEDFIRPDVAVYYCFECLTMFE